MEDHDLVQNECAERERDELSTPRRDGGRPGPISRDRPDDRSEHATTVEWKSRDHVEAGEVQVDQPEVTRGGPSRLHVRGAGARTEKKCDTKSREPDDHAR